MPASLQTERRTKVAKPRILEDRLVKERSMWVPESTWQRIADKAYELYEQRGRLEGYALEDWLKAEHIVNQELFETH